MRTLSSELRLAKRSRHLHNNNTRSSELSRQKSAIRRTTVNMIILAAPRRPRRSGILRMIGIKTVEGNSREKTR
jgi:hypothetical protein